ncbi:glycosyltransferase family 39 protein [Candidatus Woesearchaeota archaeon]|nr:glycosyltransferase family 39 protein [Candidatus Woesearchaeota archaeon]
MYKNYLNKILKNHGLLLFLIVVFGLVLRLIFFSGMGVSDDLAYSKYANSKGIDPASVLTLSTRLGLIYITALSYSLFGINDISSVLFIVLASIGNIILIFYFGKLLFNEKVGLMAAFLLSFFPLEVVYSTKLLSDIPSAFFMALGVYTFLYAEKKSKQTAYYFASGFLIGIGYLIRESALLIALFFIIYVLYKRQLKKEYFIVPLGFMIIFGVELAALYKLTGDPFFRFTAVQDYLFSVHSQLNHFGRTSFPEGLFHYPYIILTNELINFFYISIFIAICYFIINKKNNAHILLFWFISLLFYLSFGSSSFSRYVPFKADPRYLSVITLPGILLLAYFLTESKRIIKRITPLILALLLIASVISVYAYENRHLLDNLKEAYPYLKKLGKTFYTDQRSTNALDYISQYKNEIDIKPYPDDLSNLKGVYVVINKEMLRNLKASNNKLKFPKEIENPPSNWILVKEFGDDIKNRVFIYYAPEK